MARKKSSSEVQATSWSGLQHVAILLAYYVAVVSLVIYRIKWTPESMPASAPAAMFSEERAMRHVRALTVDIGDRQVSSKGIQVATEYMLREAFKIQELAKSRKDLVVEVHKEQVSGAVGMTFTDINFTNAYRSLDNVVLTITPTDGAAAAVKALLIASHYDSAVCSTGAADDAAQVGTMLEVARLIVSREGTVPAAPLVFLWTGGEEPISPAAHGWKSTSKLYPTLGAFINLEAMGGGGLPIVFQHTGAWTLEAWARGAPHARGCRVAQDVFDLGIIPADSDYRMFSARHYGHLPGVDVAFILDSSAYHTYSDTPDRIRPGIMQEMGENLVGAISSFTAYLAEHPVEAAAHEEVHERAVYFDVLGYFMVSYRDQLALKVHVAPLVISLGLPLLSRLPGSSLGGAYVALFSAALRTLVSIVCALAAPVLFGVARTLLTGVPMCWFASHWVGHTTLIPLALVAALAPYMRVYEEAVNCSPQNHGVYLSTQVQGVALTTALITWGLTAVGMTGNGLVFCLASAMAIFVALLVVVPHLSLLSLIAILLVGFIPTVLGSTIIAIFVEVIMERMSLSGYVSVVLADVVVGVLCGAAVLAITCGAMLPIIAYSLHGYRRQVMGTIVLVALGLSAYASLSSLPPYSEYRPKRIVVSHIHSTEALAFNAAAAASEGSQGPLIPSMHVSGSRLSVSVIDSTPLQYVFDHLKPAVPGYQGPSPEDVVPSNGRDFSAVFPIDIMLNGVVMKAPQSAVPLIKDLPYLRLASEEIILEAGVRRLHLELFNERHSWGIINVTGPLVAWSFVDSLKPSYIHNNKENQRQHMVRFTTQSNDSIWPFWLDVGMGAVGHEASSNGVHVELSVSYLDRTDVIDSFMNRLPSWVTESWYATVYYSEWDF